MILNADALAIPLADQSVQCVVTSPPYWGLRDYGIDGIGLEEFFSGYINNMCVAFDEVWRVLRNDGTCWLNMGDSYSTSRGGTMNKGFNERYGFKGRGKRQEHSPSRRTASHLKRKNLLGQPWRLAFALQDRGWYLRSDIVWSKPNAIPENVRDRPTRSHEYLFLLAKEQRYYYDSHAVREKAKPRQFGKGVEKSLVTEPTRNLRDVWSIPAHRYTKTHFATFPPALVEPCIRAGTKENDVVLDPFAGSGTTGLVCKELGRNFIGLELNFEYCQLAVDRIAEE